MVLTKSTIRDLQGLSRKKEREASGRFLVDGVRGVREAIRSQYTILEVLYTENLLADMAGKDLINEAGTRTSGLHQISEGDMAKISDTVTAQGVVAVMQGKQWKSTDVLEKGDRPSLIVALDAVSDPGNLGAIIRTCDWFGVDALFLGLQSVELYNPKVVRSTVGSIFHLPILPEIDLPASVEQAKQYGYTVYATAAEGDVYADEASYPEKILVILGNEAWGVSREVMQAAETNLAIRRYGSAESLNVGTACGIILASIRRNSDI
jgi:RNA methyltransferase, TrmH family